PHSGTRCTVVQDHALRKVPVLYALLKRVEPPTAKAGMRESMDRPRKVHRRIPNIVESHFGNRVRESETADREHAAAPCSQGCFDVTDAFHSSVWSPVREYQAAENLESEFQAIGF